MLLSDLLSEAKLFKFITDKLEDRRKIKEEKAKALEEERKEKEKRQEEVRLEETRKQEEENAKRIPERAEMWKASLDASVEVSRWGYLSENEVPEVLDNIEKFKVLFLEGRPKSELDDNFFNILLHYKGKQIGYRVPPDALGFDRFPSIGSLYIYNALYMPKDLPSQVLGYGCWFYGVDITVKNFLAFVRMGGTIDGPTRKKLIHLLLDHLAPEFWKYWSKEEKDQYCSFSGWEEVTRNLDSWIEQMEGPGPFGEEGLAKFVRDTFEAKDGQDEYGISDPYSDNYVAAINHVFSSLLTDEGDVIPFTEDQQAVLDWLDFR